MVWFKVDDNLAFHSKAVAAGNEALGLWVRAGSWSGQTLTEGRVPDHMVIAFGGGEAAGLLVEAGLWDRVENGYLFHDWDKYQPSKAAVEAERDAARERQRRAREKAKSLRDTSLKSPNSHAVTNGVSHGVTSGSVTVPPSQPVPALPKEEVPSSSEAASGPDRDDDPAAEVRELCAYLAGRVEENGHKIPKTFGKAWFRPCRLLLEVDGRTPDQVRAAIDWATADPFWSANIRSMQTLREKYSTLQGRAKSQGVTKKSTTPGGINWESAAARAASRTAELEGRQSA